jgi:hypothetical protein
VSVTTIFRSETKVSASHGFDHNNIYGNDRHRPALALTPPFNHNVVPALNPGPSAHCGVLNVGALALPDRAGRRSGRRVRPEWRSDSGYAVRNQRVLMWGAVELVGTAAGRASLGRRSRAGDNGIDVRTVIAFEQRRRAKA